MSRWLKSVNNLLETLDGQAENVAEEGLIDDKIGALLESGKQAILQRQSSSDLESSYEEELVSDDEDEEYEEEEDEYEQYEEELVLGSSSREGETLDSEDADGAFNSEEATVDEEEAVSIGIPNSRHSLDNISDMSFSENADDDTSGDDEKPSESRDADTNTPAEGKEKPSLDEGVDAPPKTPARFDSAKLEDLLKREASDRESSDREAGHVTPIPEENTTTNNSSQNKAIIQNSTHSAKTDNEKSTKSPLMDQSPIPPRRSLDECQHLLIDKSANIFEDDDDASGDKPKSVDSLSRTVQSDTAPLLPNRQTSLQGSKQENETATQPASSQTPQPPPPPPPPIHRASPKAPQRPIKPKDTKEYQKLTAKVQSLQAQLNKTSTELKSTEMENRRLEKQTKTLTAKLETANSEISAQNEELRRAGDRMEKDRARAQEEREDLFDEHDEEIEQLKESHQKEVEQMKGRYETQIADLKKQLEVEETRRMQEGGDWTKELEDAIDRERDSIKKVNELETEKTQLESAMDKLETEQKTLRTKLDSALHANKTSAEREREAENKLDEALSLHSRQMSQRQAREADLEKTIFDLGAALTAAQNRQNERIEPSLAPTNGEGGKYKEELESTKDELDTLRGQLNMETQRREALQEELNEIAKERTQEATSTQARQRQHDRKVSELVANIARLQKSLKEQNGITSDAANLNDSMPRLKQQLEASKTEISRLSDSLMRHHGQVEASKAEIMTLRGRLQMATKRADDAEKSLMASQTAPRSVGRTYDIEAAGVGIPTVRRRKGARSRGRSASQSIRSALNLGHGRASPLSEQIAQTVDAVDSWMVETGSFMRHEPLARIGFICYLMTLHLWTFALVVFHTTETPHADFGSLDSNPRHWRDHV